MLQIKVINTIVLIEILNLSHKVEKIGIVGRPRGTGRRSGRGRPKARRGATTGPVASGQPPTRNMKNNIILEKKCS